MENVILVIHLLLALSLIGVVLLQRSEGGGLGIGGGGGGAVSARGAASALGKVTWVLAAAFLATSITLTIVSARNSASDSVVDRVIVTPATPDAATPDAPTTPDVGGLMPPVPGNAPVTPPRAD